MKRPEPKLCADEYVLVPLRALLGLKAAEFWGLFRPSLLTFRVSYRIGLQLTNNRAYPGLVY